MTPINLKTPDQIAIMKEGGTKLNQIRLALKDISKPGIKLSAIEELAQELIKKAGGQPSFSMVDGYDWATCINLNKGLVHGVPSDTVIKAGDLVSIDVGIYYKDFHTDSAVSFIAGDPKKYPKKLKLLEAGELALEKAILEAKPGNHIGHISKAMQDTVESAGYNVAKNLTGHGLGRTLHEAPSVPCFLDKPVKETPLLEVGLTIAIEAIYMAGESATITDPQDNWTIITKDHQDSAMFEHSVAITKDGPLVLTGLI